jgi:hypothetical protein
VGDDQPKLLLPRNPVRVKFHLSVKRLPDDFEQLHRTLNELAWFAHAARDIAALTTERLLVDDNVARAHGIEAVPGQNPGFFVIHQESRCIFFWVAEDSGTVYILHWCDAGFFRRFGPQATHLARQRLLAIRDGQR